MLSGQGFNQEAREGGRSVTREPIDNPGAENDNEDHGSGQKRGLPVLALLPIVLFIALSGLFLLNLLNGRDASEVPSVLVGKPAPKIELPPLQDSPVPAFENTAFTGGISIVNVWASWCLPCRQEHPFLMEIARSEGIAVYGVNYKDSPENALRFLADLGNPYDGIVADKNGRTAIEWGVYGVPETFLIGPDGTILDKIIGPITPQAFKTKIQPHL